MLMPTSTARRVWPAAVVAVQRAAIRIVSAQTIHSGEIPAETFLPERVGAWVAFTLHLPPGLLDGLLALEGAPCEWESDLKEFGHRTTRACNAGEPPASVLPHRIGLKAEWTLSNGFCAVKTRFIVTRFADRHQTVGHPSPHGWLAASSTPASRRVVAHLHSAAG